MNTLDYMNLCYDALIMDGIYESKDRIPRQGQRGQYPPWEGIISQFLAQWRAMCSVNGAYLPMNSKDKIAIEALQNGFRAYLIFSGVKGIRLTIHRTKKAAGDTPLTSLGR